MLKQSCHVSFMFKQSWHVFHSCFSNREINLRKPDKIQNTGLRIITRGLKTTPIMAIEATTGMQYLQEERRNEKTNTKTQICRSLNQHAMFEKIKDLTKNRLKPSSFNSSITTADDCQRKYHVKSPEEWKQIVAFHSITSKTPTHIIHLTIPAIQNRNEETQIL